MACQLRTLGHQVTIVAAAVTGAEPEASIYDMQHTRSSRNLTQRVMIKLAYRIAPHWTTAREIRASLLTAVRRAIRERTIQLFEMEESFGLASWLRQGTSIPVCVRLHGPWFLNGPALGALDDRAFRRRVYDEGRSIADADAVTSSSQDTLDRTRAFYGLALKEAQVIYPPTRPIAPAERWQLEDCNPKEVLFVGRFDRHKGGDLIVEAFRTVLREVPQAKLRFVGPDIGYTDAQNRRWSLRDFLHDRLPGALDSGHVVLLGHQPLSALASWRRKALVTTICSRYENAPRSLIEAMSLGCPIVAARVGGIPEIMQDQVDGLLHRPEDPDDLAAKIVALMNDPARAAQLGGHAAVTCEKRFYPEFIATQMVDFYRCTFAL
jgi:glycosyltransferase involved in cell wall biosynthesis